MAEFFQRTIGPVAFESAASNVRRAFELGCSAVIIDGTLPDFVAAEIARAPVAGTKTDGEAQTDLSLRSEGDGSDDLFWQGGFPPGLEETGLWLIEQAKKAVAEGLRPSFDSAGNEALMKLWRNQGIIRRWHIDDAGSGLDSKGQVQWPDVHLHISGEGIKIASPQVPTAVRIQANATRSLVSHFQSVADGVTQSRDGIVAGFDAELLERGFQLLTLLPGQRLVFSEDCLHRSATGQPGELRLRAAMF